MSQHRRTAGAGTPRGSAAVALLIALLLLLPAAAGAEMFAAPDGTPQGGADNAARGKRFLAIPYPFTNESIGAGIGVAAIAEGYLQPKTMAVATGLVAEGSFAVFLKALNYRLPGTGDRVILEPDFLIGRYNDTHSFSGDNNHGNPERAGSNNSDRENYIRSDSKDYFADLITKIVLPIGHGKDAPLATVVRDRGTFVSGDTGGDVWNPLRSGRTYFELTPFIRRQVLTRINESTKTAGIDVGIRYENVDWRMNPSKGSMQRLWVSRDWGALDSDSSYTVLGADLMKYFPLGPSESARQRVIALDLWTVNCTTWDDGHRPPAYKGASMGGLSRLRAYPATRFNDQAAILYTGEYRHLLNWNPLKDFTLGGRLQVDWFELVGFGEAGRVSPAWAPDMLHSSMKYDGGVGVRTMANNIIVRWDFAAGTEGWASQLFIGHPFPFN